jgi:hypothetical protein
MQVKAANHIINRLCDNSQRRNLLAILPAPMKSVHQQQSSELLALVFSANRQSPQQI